MAVWGQNMSEGGEIKVKIFALKTGYIVREWPNSKRHAHIKMYFVCCETGLDLCKLYNSLVDFYEHCHEPSVSLKCEKFLDQESDWERILVPWDKLVTLSNWNGLYVDICWFTWCESDTVDHIVSQFVVNFSMSPKPELHIYWLRAPTVRSCSPLLWSAPVTFASCCEHLNGSHSEDLRVSSKNIYSCHKIYTRSYLFITIRGLCTKRSLGKVGVVTTATRIENLKRIKV
jgi:hypothetical protein